MSKFRSHFWFVVPAVLLMIVILIVPIFVAGIFSFTDYNLGSPDFRWIGWKNYEALTKYSSYKKMFSAYMIGNIRLNTLRSRSFFFVTQMKLLDKKSKKLKVSHLCK